MAAKDGNKVLRGTWSYNSTLTAYQQANSSIWFINWQPDVVAPNLTSTTRLAAVSVAPTVGLVTDASGEGLDHLRRRGAEQYLRRPQQVPAGRGGQAGP